MTRKVDGRFVLAVVGAQYGSEGKGVIVHHLADRFDAHVRTGGPNAGHTFKHEGQIYKMRSLPCGWTNRNAHLLIGPGAVLDPAVLIEEIRATGDIDDILARLTIDPRAWVITEQDRMQESMHDFGEKIGSTMEGVGWARGLRMERMGPSHRIGDLMTSKSPLWLLRECLGDVPDKLDAIDCELMGESAVLLEGTQGFGLSLLHGPWPFVTSADTTAAQLFADAGLPTTIPHEVLLVARTMPIRVGGNSGPLHGETTWEELSERLGFEVSERTTVTNRLRRIGTWDEELFEGALMVNGAHLVALTFCDYIDPEIRGKASSSGRIEDFIHENISLALVADTTRVPLIGTGGPDFTVFEREKLDDYLPLAR